MGAQRQQGIAVVTVMLIVVLATVTTTAMMESQHLFMRRAASYQSVEQAQALAVAGERFAAAILKRDFDADDGTPVDSREDQWAVSIPPLPIGGGTITGCIYDLNGQYNINNLVDENGVVIEEEYQILNRLMGELALPSETASAIADWIDKDDQPRNDGAEFEYYSNLESPYRAANRAMQSTTELRLVRGLNGTDEDSLAAYRSLLPFVSALPRGTTININTAAPPVLEALWDKFDGMGEDMHRWPEDKGWEAFPLCENPDADSSNLNLTVGAGQVDRTAYETLEEFVDNHKVKDNEGNDLSFPEDSRKGLGVHSDYFLVRAEIQFSDTIVKQYSVLNRTSDGKTAVRARWRSFD